MLTTEQTDNQANKVLTSIPDSIKDEVEKCAREGKDILFKDPPTDKEIEKKQDILAEIAWQSFVDLGKTPKNILKVINQLYPLKEIDCLAPNKEEIRSKIKGYLDNSNVSPIDNPYNFHVLYIKNFKNYDNDILDDILSLQAKLEKATEYHIDLPANEFGKIYSGQPLYYNTHKKQVTNNAKDHPIKIRRSENKAYVKCFSRSLIIISSLEGNKLHDWFKKQFKEIPLSTEAKRRVKSGTLSKGRGFKIPEEKFIGTLKETYNWCKKEEAEKGEKWTGTKIAKRAKRLLESRYGDKYDAGFKLSYLENIISKIKKGEV